MKRIIIKTVFFAVLSTLVHGQMSAVFAKHTNVGVPASESYVDSSDNRKVIIYVGDSRVMYCTCGAKKSAVRTNFAFCFVNGGNVSVIDRNSGKLTSHVENYIDKYRKYNPVIIFNFGLNGNGSPENNAKRIIQVYRKWMDAYPNLRFYVEGIGPTILQKGSYSNPKVIRLNRYLQAEYEPKGMWIDTYGFIQEKGLINSSGKGMKDSYHYRWKTSKRILKMLRERVENDIADTAA